MDKRGNVSGKQEPMIELVAQIVNAKAEWCLQFGYGPPGGQTNFYPWGKFTSLEEAMKYVKKAGRVGPEGWSGPDDKGVYETKQMMTLSEAAELTGIPVERLRGKAGLHVG